MIDYESNNQSSLSRLQYDRGLHYGDGLFETIAVRSGIAELLIEHINRLKESCERLKIHNVNILKIKKEIKLKAKNIGKGVIKLIVTRGSGGRGYSVTDKMVVTYYLLDYPWPDDYTKNRDSGVAVKICDLELASQPLLAGMKHLNRLENVMARMELKNTEYHEGLLCNSKQNVIEATSSNVFIVIKNKIITPKLDQCGVAGVMRDQIIKKLTTTDFNVNIQNFHRKKLQDADEIFLTNSIIGIWPVSKLDNKVYSDFSTTRKIMTALNLKYNEKT